MNILYVCVIFTNWTHGNIKLVANGRVARKGLKPMFGYIYPSSYPDTGAYEILIKVKANFP